MILGYPQRMRLQRRLSGILVDFPTSLVDDNCKLVSFFAISYRMNYFDSAFRKIYF